MSLSLRTGLWNHEASQSLVLRQAQGERCGEASGARAMWRRVRGARVGDAAMLNDPASLARREFLRFLAASPYVAAFGGVAAFMQPRVAGQRAAEAADVITRPADALNVLDFEEAAHPKAL